jgi:prepilin-type N-terminal cleavage/methylation domain-containing protein
MRRIRSQSGLTVIELLIVLVVGGILSMAAIRGFGGVHGNLATRSAQSTFMTMHAHARALAVERGEPIILRVDTTDGMVTVETGDGEVIQARDFSREYDVEFKGSKEVIRLCMTARGFADPRCGNVDGKVKLEFVRGQRSRGIALLPLGQLTEE